jgi:hypothetical protein
MFSFADQSSQNVWPPEDPYKEPAYTGPAHDFSKDSSPWTYGNGILNPTLEASNAYRRSQNSHGRSNVPPYHPAYRPPAEPGARDDSDDEQQTSSTPSRRSFSSDEFDHPVDEEEDEMDPWVRPLVRRGSEGFEVREPNREEILRNYIESRGEEAGRYRRYVPEGATASEDEDSMSSASGDDPPHQVLDADTLA